MPRFEWSLEHCLDNEKCLHDHTDNHGFRFIGWELRVGKDLFRLVRETNQRAWTITNTTHSKPTEANLGYYPKKSRQYTPF